jgi:hypothetical protein
MRKQHLIAVAIFVGFAFTAAAQDRREDREQRREGGEGRAVSVCQDSIRQQASDRFRTPNIDFRDVRADDNPGRRDWIRGEFVIRKRFGRQDVYGFTCSVNLDNGQVRTAHIDQFERRAYPPAR